MQGWEKDFMSHYQEQKLLQEQIFLSRKKFKYKKDFLCEVLFFKEDHFLQYEATDF